jgi:uncharacterized OB-fold protein
MTNATGTTPVSIDPLRLDEHLVIRYRFAEGTHAARFFKALRDEQRFLATCCRHGHVLVPPRPVCGLCNMPSSGWVDVGPSGVLTGFTVVYAPFTDPMTGEARPVPYGFGLIRFDGADTSIYHLVDETDPARLHVGLRVEPVWRQAAERTGSLADIRCFRPVEGSSR